MQDSANRLPFSPPSSLAAPQLRVGGGEKLCGTAPNFKPGSSCSCYQQAVQTDKVHINARWERGLVFLPTPTNREHRYKAACKVIYWMSLTFYPLKEVCVKSRLDPHTLYWARKGWGEGGGWGQKGDRQSSAKMASRLGVKHLNVSNPKTCPFPTIRSVFNLGDVSQNQVLGLARDSRRAKQEIQSIKRDRCGGPGISTASFSRPGEVGDWPDLVGLKPFTCLGAGAVPICSIDYTILYPVHRILKHQGNIYRMHVIYIYYMCKPSHSG